MSAIRQSVDVRLAIVRAFRRDLYGPLPDRVEPSAKADDPVTTAHANDPLAGRGTEPHPFAMVDLLARG
jgi:hypothetical protein